jgi:hypothetical protein
MVSPKAANAAVTVAQHTEREANNRSSIVRALFLMISVAASLMPPSAFAQQPKGADPKVADVFDDDEKKKETKPADTAKPPAVNDRDSIGFTQENVASQMTELEERIFRLSEALASLEPENASRLRLALKFSREEQILDQMRDTHKMLKEAELSKAETETKELIAKLEHLRVLLLAEDLDFQLKLARLRQLRETMRQIDRIAKEERRELGWSRFAIEQRKRLPRFTSRKTDLESLVRDQQALIADTKVIPKNTEGPAADTRKTIRERETKLRASVYALANDPLFADLRPAHLRSADGTLAEAIKCLEGTDSNAAAIAEDKALGLLRSELTRLNEQVTETQRTIGETEFRRRVGDQAKNRGITENLEANSARLGDVGVALRKDLIRVSESMRLAEQRLGKTAAEPAANEQSTALDVLAKARDDFARAIERLLVELRGELQARLVADLTEMHELQSSIRETTQAQAPKVLQKSRTALITVAGIAKTETELGERTETLLALVEETEYGIALPTTLRILSREMRSVGEWLKVGKLESHTVDVATRVEEDLPKLAELIRKLSPKTPPAPGDPAPMDAREQDRELNRLIAELQMVRMLQSRLRDDTVVIDRSRVAESPASTVVSREVESLELTQDEIRDALSKIAERLPIPQLGGN